MGLHIDAAVFLGLPPFDTPSNISRDDGYFYTACARRYGEERWARAVKQAKGGGAITEPEPDIEPTLDEEDRRIMAENKKRHAPAASGKVRRRAIPGPAIEPSQRKELEQAEVTLRGVVEKFSTHCDECRNDGEFAQDDLAAATLFDRLAKLSSDGRKMFDNAVLEAYAEGRGVVKFEEGRIVCTISKTERRTPQWKEEAAKMADTLHAVYALARDGKVAEILSLLHPFERHDRKRWESKVTEGYEATTSYKPKLTEGL